jgi:hypothetical protein
MTSFGSSIVTKGSAVRAATPTIAQTTADGLSRQSARSEYNTFDGSEYFAAISLTPGRIVVYKNAKNENGREMPQIKREMRHAPVGSRISAVNTPSAVCSST